MFMRLSIGLVVLGAALSVYFHIGMADHARGVERSRSDSARRAAQHSIDSWDSMEGGAGHVPLPPSPRAIAPAETLQAAELSAPAANGSWDSWDSFEGLGCGIAASSWMPPLPTLLEPPLEEEQGEASAAEDSGINNAAISPGDDVEAGAEAPAPAPTALSEWLQMPALYAVAAQYMCARLLLNTSQVYLPLYLVMSLRLNTSAIAKAPLVLYLASLGATGVLREANERFGRAVVMLVSLVAATACSLIWQSLPPGADLQAFATAALLGWSSSCAMVTTLSMGAASRAFTRVCVIIDCGGSGRTRASFPAADVIGDRCGSCAIIYGLLSLTDKVSSGASRTLAAHCQNVKLWHQEAS